MYVEKKELRQSKNCEVLFTDEGVAKRIYVLHATGKGVAWPPRAPNACPRT